MAHAATMTVGTQTTLGSNPAAGSIRISFYDGAAKYSAPSASGTLGDGTLLDYSFYGNTRQTASSTLAWVERGAGSADYLSVAQVADASNLANPGSAIGWPRYWTSTDPNTDFSSTPDYSASGTNESIGTANNVLGTIDISNLSSGTVYFMFGSFAQSGSISLQMTGTDQTPITDSMTWGSPGSINVVFLQSLTFDNSDGSYDTISYNYLNTGAASRGRFGFVALDGIVAVPEPSAAFLGSLGLLALLRRRRA